MLAGWLASTVGIKVHFGGSGHSHDLRDAQKRKLAKGTAHTYLSVCVCQVEVGVSLIKVPDSVKS